MTTFVKDGASREAVTAAEAVKLRHDGWVEGTPSTVVAELVPSVPNKEKDIGSKDD